jgi:hypothetical protein
MLKGTVTFRAKINGHGLTFPLLVFNPNESGVEKVEVEAKTGYEIISTIYIASVATDEEGIAIAEKVNMATLNRISFFHDVSIDHAESVGHQFSALNPQPGVFQVSPGNLTIKGYPTSLVVGVPSAIVKAELEGATPPGEINFGLFRSARQSMGSAEEFMTFYHILLMLFNDSQSNVDNFIISEEPAVPQSQRPGRGSTVIETIYTRLRNELAHKRAGINLNNSKKEMANRLGPLRLLTKRAIELYS